MRVTVRSLGRSCFVSIPDALLDQAGLHDMVDIQVQNGTLVLRPVSAPVRQGWAKAAMAIAVAGDDALVWDGAPDR